MSFHTETEFVTGPYVVTRAGTGEWVNGRFVRVASTTFELVGACEHAGAGLDDQDQQQGQETSETRTIYSDVQLFASRPSTDDGDTGVGREADVIAIDGEPWIVTKVAYHGVISKHYVATVERLYPGRAA